MSFSGLGKLIKDLVAGTPTDSDCFIFGNADVKKITLPNLKKALGIETVENRVENIIQRTGATDYTGEYKGSWTLTTQYQDIGNTRKFDNKYFSASSGNSDITVKEGGLYLILTSINVKSEGYTNIWAEILKNGITAETVITAANGYTTIHHAMALTLIGGDYISMQISKESEDVNTTCDGGGYLQLIKLT